MLLSALLATATASAAPDYAALCFGRAAQKLQMKAGAYRCAYDADSLHATAVDDREGVASKYVYYTAATKSGCPMPEINVTVQYANGRCI